MNKRNPKLEVAFVHLHPENKSKSTVKLMVNSFFWKFWLLVNVAQKSQSQQSNLWSTGNCKVAFVHLRPETPPALFNTHHPYPRHIHQIFYLYDFIPLSNLPKNTKIITHEVEQILGDLYLDRKSVV